MSKDDLIGMRSLMTGDVLAFKAADNASWELQIRRESATLFISTPDLAWALQYANELQKTGSAVLPSRKA
jgi:hypothetical protein